MNDHQTQANAAGGQSVLTDGLGVCGTCQHKTADEDAWPCKHCTPDNRRYERSEADERQKFEAWMKRRGTPLALEHNQAFDAWQAAKADARAAMVPALELLKEYMDSVGGCDHAVGICLCGEYRVFEEAAKVLGWKTPNAKVSGSGMASAGLPGYAAKGKGDE